MPWSGLSHHRCPRHVACARAGGFRRLYPAPDGERAFGSLLRVLWPSSEEMDAGDTAERGRRSKMSTRGLNALLSSIELGAQKETRL
jgi:hypothetical protein